MSRNLKTLALVLAAAIAPSAFAATTADINVSANVNNACAISGGDLVFGIYTWEADKTGSMNLTVKCTTDAGYTVALNDGGNAVTGQRKLSDGTNLLNYGLFSDSGASTTPWNATTTVAGTGNGANQTLSVYGRIASGQSTVPASNGADYLDTVVATVDFTP